MMSSQLYVPLEMLKLKYISGSSNIYTQTNNNATSNTCEYVCSVCGSKEKDMGMMYFLIDLCYMPFDLKIMV